MQTFYTDGGCHNESGSDKGVGAWAFVEFNDDAETVKVYAQFVNDTTNNRTEMLAVINAIKHSTDDVLIISDSGYIVKGYQHPAYLDRWIQNNWKTSTNKPVLNQDLWHEIVSLTYSHGVQFKLVKGHYRDPDPIHAFWNSIVDRACTWIMQNCRTDGLVELEFDVKNKQFIKANGISI